MPRVSRNQLKRRRGGVDLRAAGFFAGGRAGAFGGGFFAAGFAGGFFGAGDALADGFAAGLGAPLKA